MVVAVVILLILEIVDTNIKLLSIGIRAIVALRRCVRGQRPAGPKATWPLRDQVERYTVA